MTNEELLFQKMSGVFLTNQVPFSIINTEDNDKYFADLDDWVRDNYIDSLEHLSPSEVIELIDDAVAIAIQYARGL